MLTYDAENHLQQVKQGSTAPGYTYDGDGNRVTAVMGSSTTVYVGAYYEKMTNGSSTTITKYYQAGGQRVALRVNGVVRWLATDHLGSTALTVSESGGRLSEIRYKPWGESRYTFGATPTQRRFTGQVLDEVAGGLYFYNARYYDPALGRFVSADTLIPNPGNPQNLNRYSYALGNPLRFVDPSGHRECEDADCLHTEPVVLMPPNMTKTVIGVPPEAILATDPILTTYYTPIYDPQPDGQGNQTDNPNLWADRSSGSAYVNARLQGSFVINGRIWKYDLSTRSFYALNVNPDDGVPVVLGHLTSPVYAVKTSEGKTVYNVTGAVAAPCPWNVRCGNPSVSYAPAYKQSKNPKDILYVVTDDLILVVTPLDSGYGLAPNQIDLYVGFGRKKPGWTYGSTANPHVWILP